MSNLPVYVSSPTQIEFSPDGTKFWALHKKGNHSCLSYFTLGTAWNLSTLTPRYTKTFPSGSIVAFAWGNSGTSLFALDRYSSIESKFVTYSASTAYDITTLSFLYKSRQSNTTHFRYYSTSFDVYVDEAAFRLGTNYAPYSSGNIFLKPDGTELFYIGSVPSGKSTAALLTSLTFSAFNPTTYNFGQQTSSVSSSFLDYFTFKSDGTVVYGLDISADQIRQHSISSAWNLSSTVTNTGTYSLPAMTPSCFTFKADGTVMYVVDTGSTLREFPLATAWNVTTASVGTTRTLRGIPDSVNTSLTLSAANVNLMMGNPATTSFPVGSNQIRGSVGAYGGLDETFLNMFTNKNLLMPELNKAYDYRPSIVQIPGASNLVGDATSISQDNFFDYINYLIPKGYDSWEFLETSIHGSAFIFDDVYGESVRVYIMSNMDINAGLMPSRGHLGQFVIPPSANRINIKAWGAGGGAGGTYLSATPGYGGAGGYAETNLYRSNGDFSSYQKIAFHVGIGGGGGAALWHGGRGGGATVAWLETAGYMQDSGIHQSTGNVFGGSSPTQIDTYLGLFPANGLRAPTVILCAGGGGGGGGCNWSPVTGAAGGSGGSPGGSGPIGPGGGGATSTAAGVGAQASPGHYPGRDGTIIYSHGPSSTILGTVGYNYATIGNQLPAYVGVSSPIWAGGGAGGGGVFAGGSGTYHLGDSSPTPVIASGGGGGTVAVYKGTSVVASGSGVSYIPYNSPASGGFGYGGTGKYLNDQGSNPGNSYSGQPGTPGRIIITFYSS